MKKITSFTLIELLIVIVIIGILTVVLIPRLAGMQSKARDTRRIADLKQLQTAIELYFSDNGSYPITVNAGFTGNRRGNCSLYGSHPLSGPTGYVPNLAPNYMIQLPHEDKPTYPGTCYLYRSDGKDFMLLADWTIEGVVPLEFKRPSIPNSPTYAIYSPGAKNW